MKELRLDTPVLTFEGEPFQITPDLKLTVGRGIVQHLSAMKSDGDAQFQTFALGVKLSKANINGETMLLEQAEYDHILRAVEQNGVGYVDVVQAQIRQALKDCPDVDVEKKGD